MPLPAISRSSRDLVATATLWYLVNRAIVTVALLLSKSLAGPRFGWRSILATGDSRFYLGIAQHGYFDLPRSVGGQQIYSSIAFFPLLPMLIRAFDAVLPGDELLAGMAVCFAAGWLACVAVTFLARDLYGDETARRAAALIACFPGTFVFAFVYTEGLLVLGAAAALFLLRKERWAWAGLAGAVAAAARPSGVAIVAAAGVVAVIAIVRRREWSSLLAPALSCLGLVGYEAYLWANTDRPLAWFENQRDFWHQRNNAGGYLVSWLTKMGPGGGPMPTDHRYFGFIVLALIPVLIGFYRHRPDLATTVYVTASLVITLSSSLGPRPRFLLAAFPLLLPFADRWTGTRHQVLLGLGFGLLAATTIYYAAGIPLSIEHGNFAGPVP